MNHLHRDLAPISDAGWALIDAEAKARLTSPLAARRVVDFSGPHGWTHSATNLGRTRSVASPPGQGIGALQRAVLPLVELRADFTVSRSELRDADRGAPDVELSDLDDAAHRIAVAENIAVFHGVEDAAITGLVEASPHEPTEVSGGPESYPRAVASAVELLLQGGIAGPYALALGRDEYIRVIETAEHGGYPLLEHLKQILDGPIVWAPGLAGAVVLSLRGGDFLFDSGEDLSIGYDRHDGEVAHLYLQESFSFIVATPEAAVPVRS
jgi:uncharacterized linocin/CFP29 family protein